MSQVPAILILGEASLPTAGRIQAALPGALIHGLRNRVKGADIAYAEFGQTLRELYLADHPIVALCAAGIVIRSLAPLLQSKSAEPPVLAVAEDGSTVVPLLGGLRGVNELARDIATALDVRPAITTTGELRFGTCLLNPPAGYRLRNVGDGKTVIANLLAGARLRIEGDAPWLKDARLPLDPAGTMTARVTARDIEPAAGELVFHPASIVVAVKRTGPDLRQRIEDTLRDAGLSPMALALMLAGDEWLSDATLTAVADQFGIPLRFLPAGDPVDVMMSAAITAPIATHGDDRLCLGVAARPADIQPAGRKRGRLTVVGLGPGNPVMMIPAARKALDDAEDIVGYDTYVKMAGPLRLDQTVHASDNREELFRARQAFDLAATGRSVAVVSSGDPGVFAMAAAVLEALDGATDARWRGVELVILPGVSAALAAAARIGAPLGHDFCIISLSDNLKPWSVIIDRLEHAAAGDFAMAFYNPISKARPWQLGEAIALLRRHRVAETPVVLGRDVGRPAESVRITTLGDLTPEQVDMRTVVIVGSSTTRVIDGTDWVYTPRWYGTPPAELKKA